MITDSYYNDFYSKEVGDKVLYLNACMGLDVMRDANGYRIDHPILTEADLQINEFILSRISPLVFSRYLGHGIFLVVKFLPEGIRRNDKDGVMNTLLTASVWMPKKTNQKYNMVYTMVSFDELPNIEKGRVLAKLYAVFGEKYNQLSDADAVRACTEAIALLRNSLVINESALSYNSIVSFMKEYFSSTVDVHQDYRTNEEDIPLLSYEREMLDALYEDIETEMNMSRNEFGKVIMGDFGGGYYSNMAIALKNGYVEREQEQQKKEKERG